LRSKWEGTYDVEEDYPSGGVKLKGDLPPTHELLMAIASSIAESKR
jgi:hypothetical protein